MTQKEQELDAALNQLAEAATKGFNDISRAVTAAADRVVQALQESGVDLTDEIAAVNTLKDAVNDSVADATERLAAILPAPDAEPPADSPVTEGDDADEEDVEDPSESEDGE